MQIRPAIRGLSEGWRRPELAGSVLRVYPVQCLNRGSESSGDSRDSQVEPVPLSIRGDTTWPYDRPHRVREMPEESQPRRVVSRFGSPPKKGTVSPAHSDYRFLQDRCLAMEFRIPTSGIRSENVARPVSRTEPSF